MHILSVEIEIAQLKSYIKYGILTKIVTVTSSQIHDSFFLSENWKKYVTFDHEEDKFCIGFFPFNSIKPQIKSLDLLTQNFLLHNP